MMMLKGLCRVLLMGVCLLLACRMSAKSTPPTDPAAARVIPAFVVPANRPDVAHERFMVIGDMGTGRPSQHRVAAAMALRAREEPVDFILTVGDNFYLNGVQSSDDPQWQTKFEEVYSDPSLQVPFFPSLGNHDHYGNPQAQIDYGRNHPRWNMPAFHYTFTRELGDGTQVQFFAVDSNPIHEQDPAAAAQLAWLDKQLANSRARWKIVYGHHSLYGHNPRRGHNATMIARLEPLLVKHGVDVYFAGHDHTLEMIKPIHGVHYVISGAAAGPDWAYSVNWTDESFYAATLGGFTLCTVSANALVVEFVRLDGRTQYAHTITKHP